MSRVGFGKKVFIAAAIAALGATASATNAATITFASFNDTAANQWSYNNGTGALTTSGATANWTSFAPPNQILNYNGPVTYSVTAAATGAVTGTTTLSQTINGTMTFKNGSTTVLSVVFSGAILSGTAGSNSSGLTADTTIVGQVISYTADPSVQVGSFTSPFSFSISFTTIPGLTKTGSNFTSFTATATGSFSADQSGASPTPLPIAAWGGMSLMGAIGGVGAFIKRRRR